MAGAEGVVDVDIAEFGELGGECRIAALLAVVEAQVLQHQHLARLQRLRRPTSPQGRRPHRPCARACRAIRPGAAATRSMRNGASFAGSPLGRPRWLMTMDSGAGVEKMLQRRQRGADAAVVGDVAGCILRHVEIDPHQHLLAVQVSQIVECFLSHVSSPEASPRMRFG